MSFHSNYLLFMREKDKNVHVIYGSDVALFCFSRLTSILGWPALIHSLCVCVCVIYKAINIALQYLCKYSADVPLSSTDLYISYAFVRCIYLKWLLRTYTTQWLYLKTEKCCVRRMHLEARPNPKLASPPVSWDTFIWSICEGSIDVSLAAFDVPQSCAFISVTLS